MSAAEDLVAYIADRRIYDEGNTPERDAEAAAFEIDDLAKATWAVRKIAQHRARLAEAQQVADAERARINDWLEDERRRCEQGTVHLEGLLYRYHEGQLVEDPKRKTIKTPAGDLVARKSPDSIDVDDAVFVPWAEANAPGLLNPPKAPTPAKAAIKKATGDVVDGQVVFADTGEFLPGVAWVTGETTLKVVTDEAVQL